MSINSALSMQTESVLASVDALLFDFDGPICTLFAAYSPRITAADARLEFSRQGIALPMELQQTPGALALLQWAELNTPDTVSAIERIQEAGELRAAASAEPTPHSMSAVVAAAQNGFKLAIVSNNASSAIRAYLDAHGLEVYFAHISGRIPGDIKSMKPYPDSLSRAAAALGVPIEHCVMIGDSVTDIEAANLAGAHSIGYATDDSAATALTAAGAHSVICTMAELASALQNSTQTT